MDILVLFGLLALFIFGPRRDGRRPGPLAILFGLFLLIWLAAAFGMGWAWKSIVGSVAQP